MVCSGALFASSQDGGRGTAPLLATPTHCISGRPLGHFERQRHGARYGSHSPSGASEETATATPMPYTPRTAREETLETVSISDIHTEEPGAVGGGDTRSGAGSQTTLAATEDYRAALRVEDHLESDCLEDTLGALQQALQAPAPTQPRAQVRWSTATGVPLSPLVEPESAQKRLWAGTGPALRHAMEVGLRVCVCVCVWGGGGQGLWVDGLPRPGYALGGHHACLG